jgi:hypothetical protein
VFDPRALYDWHRHRFILAFGNSDRKNASYYVIAVSKNDDPTGSWYVYRFRTRTSSVYNDFLRIGQDRQGVYLASTLFQMHGSCCGAYIYEEWIFLAKSELYIGKLPNTDIWFQYGMQVDGQFTDSTQPANVWSPYDNPRAEFLVTSFNINYGGGNCVNGCTGMTVWAVANPFGWIDGGPNPEVSELCCTSTSTYSLPPNASQPGAPNSIETLDTRITGAVTYKSGVLHAALTTLSNVGPWSDILVYRILPALDNEDPRCTGKYLNLCPQITGAYTQDESRADYGGNFAFYPTPQPDLKGNVATVFNFAGPNCAICYLGIGYITQRVSEPLDTFSNPGLLLASGQARYKRISWGRYTAAAPEGVGYAAAGAVATPVWGSPAPMPNPTAAGVRKSASSRIPRRPSHNEPRRGGCHASTSRPARCGFGGDDSRCGGCGGAGVHRVRAATAIPDTGGARKRARSGADPGTQSGLARVA